jgi:hypothetical protein
MAILDFSATAAAPARNSNARMPFGNMEHPAQDRPNSKLWLNIGYEANGRFITLPLGQGIDTMAPGKVQGQNEDFVKQRTAQNALLQALQQLGGTLQPGQEQELNLKVKLRRVNEQLEITKENNEYALDIKSLLVMPEAAE